MLWLEFPRPLARTEGRLFRIIIVNLNGGFLKRLSGQLTELREGQLDRPGAKEG